MLILTRRVGESVAIHHPDGSVSRVIIRGVRGRVVRVGVDAPRGLQIARQAGDHGYRDAAQIEECNRVPQL